VFWVRVMRDTSAPADALRGSQSPAGEPSRREPVFGTALLACDHDRGSAAAGLHDPRARVEPDTVLALVLGQHLAQPFQRELTTRRIEERESPLRAGEAADPLERGTDVSTVEDGLVDIRECDVGEPGRSQDPADRRGIGEGERIEFR